MHIMKNSDQRNATRCTLVDVLITDIFVQQNFVADLYELFLHSSRIQKVEPLNYTYIPPPPHVVFYIPVNEILPHYYLAYLLR